MQEEQSEDKLIMQTKTVAPITLSQTTIPTRMIIKTTTKSELKKAKSGLSTP